MIASNRLTDRKKYTDPRKSQGPVIPNFILFHKTLEPSAKLLYASLVSFFGSHGCFPAQETLAENLNLSVSTVQRSVAALSDEGLLEVITPTGHDRLVHRTIRYLFPAEPLIKATEMEDAEVERLRTRQIDVSGHPVDDMSGHPVDDMSTVTNLNSNQLNYIPAAPRAGARAVPHPRWRKMAERLATAISKTRKINCSSKIGAWSKSFEALHRLEGIEVLRIKKALCWYCDNLPSRSGEQFFLVIHSGDAFRKKFLQLEAAIKRDQRERGEEEESTGESDGSAGSMKVVGEGFDMPEDIQRLLNG